VELEPGGSQRPVTKLNRQEFVDKAVDWYLNCSIDTVFREFRSGFYSVASGSAMVLFNHHELELLVCGLPHLDFAALRHAARYEGGYGAEQAYIVAFWDVIMGFSLEQKRHFLTFVTGSDRAPMGGLGKLRMLIQRSGGDTERLPTAHTCFNVLLLPEYSSREKLQRMLTTAINNAEGFGLQ
jgi:ubiquitin-protein ligase E3 A